MTTTYGLCAIGNAIVDVLAHTTDDFLQIEHITKGGMTLIDEDRAESLYSKMGQAVEASGGSAANTVAGYASMGGKAAFMGKVRDDQLGKIFRHDMQALGATFITPPAHQGPATARCFVLVTPDAQRSMNTYLGASVGFSPSDLDPALIKAAQITYLEGYLFDKPEAQLAFLEALRIASHAERKLALTLSDTFCVERHKPAFRNLIKSGVDIVFANQNELLALTETTEIQQAVATMQDSCPLLVTTLGEQGAIICARGQSPIKIAAAPVTTLVDSTGAGDQFAAGFLYGLTHGHDLTTCGQLGALAAAEVISHFGPRPEQPLAQLAKHILAA
jgi:sugar/nucleoside kinase (ribokinase family)